MRPAFNCRRNRQSSFMFSLCSYTTKTPKDCRKCRNAFRYCIFKEKKNQTSFFWYDQAIFVEVLTNISNLVVGNLEFIPCDLLNAHKLVCSICIAAYLSCSWVTNTQSWAGSHCARCETCWEAILAKGPCCFHHETSRWKEAVKKKWWDELGQRRGKICGLPACCLVLSSPFKKTGALKSKCGLRFHEGFLLSAEHASEQIHGKWPESARSLCCSVERLGAPEPLVKTSYCFSALFLQLFQLAWNGK